jgi:hypothetical protein
MLRGLRAMRWRRGRVFAFVGEVGGGFVGEGCGCTMCRLWRWTFWVGLFQLLARCVWDVEVVLVVLLVLRANSMECKYDGRDGKRE